ncbi:MAG: VIT family protein [Alphaproteobacteria bacterium]|nr:VIT family protein [Alphaproteobacteria bacterium]
MSHAEGHKSHRGGWLRAAVLGANDGIVSTASLVLGVAAADGGTSAVLTAGVAGLVGGALSMAAGEFVSVSSQRDVEEADLAREREELRTIPQIELDELTGIFADKGLPEDLARQVAVVLTEKDALAAHAREELNIDPDDLARPWQAAWTSALSFAVGAALPLLAIVLAPGGSGPLVTLVAATAALGVLGGWSARLGGAPVRPAVVRVVVGGLLAMGLTMGIGTLFGVAV